MPRSFNLEVFNKTIGGGASAPPVYRTSAEFYSVFGSADVLLAQILVYSAATVPATVSVAYELNNSTSPETWSDSTDITQDVTLTAISSAPAQEYLRIVSGEGIVLPAYGRFSVSSDTPGVTVKIVVCGRSS